MLEGNGGDTGELPISPRCLEGLPSVLRVEEVARVLRIGRNAAYEAIRAGDIPSFRLGHKIRVPRMALERFLIDACHGPVEG